MSLEPTQSFGRYRIEKKLGQGGMGSVFLAVDTQLDRRVALKTMLVGESEASSVVERFYREARAAATLRHPHLCSVFDVGQIDGVHFLTMAYIEGHSLAHHLAGGKVMPGRPAAILARKLALALAEAHRRGVIHRDLKPANVMIDGKGNPVVVDFGLARRDESGEPPITRTGGVMGTPAYMSPEQVNGEVRSIGPSTDIYTLGVILFELLTGRMPFEAPFPRLLWQIIDEPAPAPSSFKAGIAPELDAICRRAMAKRRRSVRLDGGSGPGTRSSCPEPVSALRDSYRRVELPGRRWRSPPRGRDQALRSPRPAPGPSPGPSWRPSRRRPSDTSGRSSSGSSAASCWP